jgi:hypothetical protein
MVIQLDRASNLWPIRSPTLYPTELQARAVIVAGYNTTVNSTTSSRA